LHRYAEMRKTIALPAAGLTLEQARAAALLSTTYGNAQDKRLNWSLCLKTIWLPMRDG
jgi:hypothetical protein